MVCVITQSSSKIYTSRTKCGSRTKYGSGTKYVGVGQMRESDKMWEWDKHPNRGPKGQGIDDRQHGGCISIFAGVFSLNFNTTHTKGY